MVYNILYLSCGFEVVRFDLRQRVPIFDVGIKLGVVLANVVESACAESCGIESWICCGDILYVLLMKIKTNMTNVFYHDERSCGNILLCIS